MWINTDTERKVPPVFREHPYTVFMDIAQLELAEEALLAYNNQLVSLDVPVQEREDLLQLIRKFRKLSEEL